MLSESLNLLFSESPSLLTFLFVLAIFAGVIDTMAGGGGLLVVPGLMAAGLDPVSALATNKLQAIFGTSSAVIQFWRHGRVRLKEHILPSILAFLAAIAGASALTHIDTGVLKRIVPFVLIFIALLLLAKPSLGSIARHALLPRIAGTLILMPLIGFYDGLFGPGTGTFYAFGAVAILGAGLDEATIRAKIYNFASNCGGLYFLSAEGHTAWAYGAVMAAGTFIGGIIGARLILRHGVRLIKPLVVVMSLAMSFNLLWQQGTIQEISKLIDAARALAQHPDEANINLLPWQI